jgi:hypothetical protein
MARALVVVGVAHPGLPLGAIPRWLGVWFFSFPVET